MDNFVSQSLFWSVTSVIGGLSAAVVGLIAYIVRKNDDKIKEIKGDIDMVKVDVVKNKEFLETKLIGMIREFQSGIEALKSAVSEMKEYISVVKVQHNEQINNINARLDNKRAWLEEHDSELKQHEKRITVVEVNCRHHVRDERK